MSPAPAFPEGLRDRYELERVLGEGGFGTVFLARDQRVDRMVAIKVLHVVDDEVRVRFEREARVTASLQHHHIVRVYDSGLTADDTAFIAYEYVEGPDLESAYSGRSMPPEEVLRLGIALGDALHLAHQEGVVHRDVKPANVLLREGRYPVLCDFGIARVVAGETMATAEGVILGTPAYLAPEVFRGAPPSAASDQFALAATLLEVATGRGPYPGMDLPAVLEALRSARPSGFPSEARGRLGTLEAVLERGIAPTPEERYPSCADFTEALAQAWKETSGDAVPVAGTPTVQLLRPEPVPAGPAVTPRRATREQPEVPRGRRGALMLVVLLIGLSIGLLGTWRAAPDPEPAATSPPTAPEVAEALERRAGLRRALEQSLESLDALFSEPIPLPGVRTRDFTRAHRPVLAGGDLVPRFEAVVDAFLEWLRAVDQAARPDAASPFDGEEEVEVLTQVIGRLDGVEHCLDFLTETGALQLDDFREMALLATAGDALRGVRGELHRILLAILDLRPVRASHSLHHVAANYAVWAPLPLRVELVGRLEATLREPGLSADILASLATRCSRLVESIASDPTLGPGRCASLAEVDLVGPLRRIPAPPVEAGRVSAAFAALEAQLRLVGRCGLERAPVTWRGLYGEVIRIFQAEVEFTGEPIATSPGHAALLREIRDGPEPVDVLERELRRELVAFLEEAPGP